GIGGTGPGGGVFNEEGGRPTLASSLLALHRAIGGGGEGGGGQGGGSIQRGPNPICTADPTAPRAIFGCNPGPRGAAGGARAGRGVGRGLSLRPGGAPPAAPWTRFLATPASTSDGDVFGVGTLIRRGSEACQGDGPRRPGGAGFPPSKPPPAAGNRSALR